MTTKNNNLPNNPQINTENLQPFKKFCMTIGALPSSYLESLTYQELLLWFCDYLKNTVIPTVNNNAKAVEELQNLYVELKDYVDNYFTNLDVQEEINKKLDEMVEDGTFLQIINKFISGNTFTPEMFGAKGDGITDDTEAFENILNNYNYCNIISSESKIYCISRKLQLQSYQRLNLGGATLKCKDGIELDYLLEVDTSLYGRGNMQNLRLDCNNICGGIYFKYSTTYTLNSVTVLKFPTIGIYVKQGNIIMHNCFLVNRLINNNSIGIQLDGTDSKIYDVLIQNCRTAVLTNSGINYFNGVHCWLDNGFSINGSIAFYIKGQTQLTNCYIDTYETAIINDNNQLLLIEGLKVYINPEIYNAKATLPPKFIKFIQSINNIENYPSGASKTYFYSFNLIMTCNFTPIFSNCNTNDVMKYLPLKKIAQNINDFNLVDFYKNELTNMSDKFKIIKNELLEYDEYYNLSLVLLLNNLENISIDNPILITQGIPFLTDNKIKNCFIGSDTGVSKGEVTARLISTQTTKGLTITFKEAPQLYNIYIDFIIPKK